MKAEDFLQLKYGDKIWNHKTNVKFEIQEIVSDSPLVRKISNLKYIGITDYINENTCNDYSRVPVWQYETVIYFYKKGEIMKVEIKKTLISDNGKRFNKGTDIAFTYNTKRYIGEIVDMTEDNLILTRVECKCIKDTGYVRLHIDGMLSIPLNEIKDCNYVSCDWAGRR